MMTTQPSMNIGAGGAVGPRSLRMIWQSTSSAKSFCNMSLTSGDGGCGVIPSCNDNTAFFKNVVDD